MIAAMIEFWEGQRQQILPQALSTFYRRRTILAASSATQGKP